ncbi:MAG: YifB family Mg chelatase-like AAA ATPase [Parahaliea sp.]
MELSTIYSRAGAGLDAPLVQVETHLSNGLPAFNIVGLPETTVREAKDRVRSALLNSHFDFPDRRITVNLAPADLPKEGGRFDLPIALGILSASGQLPKEPLLDYEFVSELALDGRLRGSGGAIPAAQACTRAGRTLVTAPDCASLAARVPGSRIIAASDLLRLCAHLNGRSPLPDWQVDNEDLTPESYPDLAQVQGQALACRALEIAASGGHNLLLSGPPGTGKTLLASCLPGLLPALSMGEALTVAAIHNLQDSMHNLCLQRPFRQPHHSSSAAALVGGGSKPRPGEISLAHGGVLFLDELPEFGRHVLDMLREPMESGAITLSRANYKFTYPARFQLVAAMNPCPCGYFGDAERHCRCTPEQVQRYHQRLSGPLLDRIDIQVRVPRVAAGDILKKNATAEASAVVRARIQQCWQRQIDRQQTINATLGGDKLLTVCQLDNSAEQQLLRAADSLKLSVRALHRCLRLARTLADMEEAQTVSTHHIAEALAYRGLDISS